MLKATGLTYPEIATELHCNPKSLKTGMQRKGLVHQAAEARKATLSRTIEHADAVLEHSKDTRLILANAVRRDVSFLSDAKPSRTDSQAFTRYSRLAPVLAAAEKVYGWRADDTPQATVSFSRLDLHLHSDVPTSTEPVAQAIDVESKPVESTPQEPKA